ncbi:MAG: hypothetical protein ABSG80_08880 [Verrucomicrobiota bacterium]
MKIIFLFCILAALSCFAADTNTDYAAIAAQEDAPNMILSEETNSIRSGVWINNSNHVIVIQNGKMVSEARLAMLNTSTNNVFFWSFWPSTDLQYEIKMLDDQERVIPKTSYGKQFGRIPSKNPDNLPALNMQKLGLHIGGIFPKGEVFCDGSKFDPLKDIPKCFELKKTGNYRLILAHHIYVVESRADGYFLKRVTFSPVSVDVKVIN